MITTLAPTANVAILQEDPRCRPLLRLRQLAEEITSALEREDFDIVGRAADLLPPAMADCKRIDPAFAQSHAEIARFAQETQEKLSSCEKALQEAMEGVATEMRRLRLAQKNREWLQRQEYAVVGRRLDAAQ